MEFKVQKKSIKVTVGEQSYDLSLPSVAQSKKIKKDLEEVEAGGAVEVMADYVASLGLPKEVVDSLDYDTFLELYSFIHNPKKNSTSTT